MSKVLFLILASLTINASAASFYDQFIYKMQGSCIDMNSIVSEDIYTDAIALKTEADGTVLTSWVGVQLFADGTYWADYAEYEMPTELQKFYKNGIEGRWTVSGDEILLENLGVGKPMGVDAIAFTFSNAVKSQELVNKVTTFSKSSIPLGPKYTSPEEFCKNK